MEYLHQLDLVKVLQHKANSGTPILGICLGMQLLADASEEGVLNGLGLIPGYVKHLVKKDDIKIPHMGWNKVNVSKSSLLYNNIDIEKCKYYFVHSYHFIPVDDNHITGTTFHGSTITVSIQNNNIYGVQFHPEKSHKFGMYLLKNFINHC
jgi:glutamine amidotransferase